MSDELDVVRRFIEAIDKLTPAQRKDMLRELRQRANEAAAEPRWVVDRGWIKPKSLPIYEGEVHQAAADLNTLHEHGAVLRVRDWQEAPDDETPVLRWLGNGWGFSTGKHVRRRRSPWAAMPPGPGEVSDG